MKLNKFTLFHGTLCNNYLKAFTTYYWGLHFSDFELNYFLQTKYFR